MKNSNNSKKMTTFAISFYTGCADFKLLLGMYPGNNLDEATAALKVDYPGCAVMDGIAFC